MSEQFYDRVTKKFGTFSNIPHPVTDYPEGNPEAIFEQEILERSGKDKIALDIGCGDGRPLPSIKLQRVLKRKDSFRFTVKVSRMTNIMQPTRTLISFFKAFLSLRILIQ